MNDRVDYPGRCYERVGSPLYERVRPLLYGRVQSRILQMSLTP